MSRSGKSTSNVKGRSSKDGKVVYLDARTLKPSPENKQLYRERSLLDTDYQRLLESVRLKGVQAPLLISLDDYIISGHQRCQAASESGRFLVPVLRLKVFRSMFTADEWLALLREHNTGREKSFDELVREKLVDIDPQEAVSLIVDDEVQRCRVRIPTIAISSKKMKRSRISAAKRGMANAVLEVLKDLEDYLPVSVRAIHYRLLVKAFLRNSNTNLPYLNDRDSYKDLSDITTRMRLDSEIPWDSICDATRPVTTWSCWRSPDDFIAEQSAKLFCGFARQLLQSQTQHFEIVVEKLTVKHFLRPVAARYCMPVVIMRGNSSIDSRHLIDKRFRASGKRRLFLICLGDCDPDGDSIVETTLRSMRDDFRHDKVRGVRVAMTHGQADALHLPHDLEAKKNSSNYRKFVEKHGRTDCYELEAVSPEVLQGWLDEAIRGVIDTEAYNHEVQQQTKNAGGILAMREAVLEFIRGYRPD